MNVIEILGVDASKPTGACATAERGMHPPVSSADMLPFVIACQAVRTSMGGLCDGMDVASLTCELNVARAAGGLLALKHYQTQIASTFAACYCFDKSDRDREAERSTHFHIEKLPLVNVSLLHERYESDARWPDGQYWYIWYAMCVHRALRTACPSSALAKAVEKCVRVLRTKYYTLKKKVSEGEGTCSAYALSSIGETSTLIDAKLVQRIVAHAAACDASSSQAGTATVARARAHVTTTPSPCVDTANDDDNDDDEDDHDRDEDDKDDDEHDKDDDKHADIRKGEKLESNDDGDDGKVGCSPPASHSVVTASEPVSLPLLHAVTCRECAESASSASASAASEEPEIVNVARQTHAYIYDLMQDGRCTPASACAASEEAHVTSDDVIRMFSGQQHSDGDDGSAAQCSVQKRDDDAAAMESAESLLEDAIREVVEHTSTASHPTGNRYSKRLNRSALQRVLM